MNTTRIFRSFLQMILFLSVPFLSHAQKPATIDEYRRSQFGIETPLCFGLTHIQTGITTNTNQKIYISPGGGSSMGIRYGTMVSRKLQFSLGLAFQWGSMNPPVSNASGGFRRLNVNPQLRRFFNIPNNRSRFYIGAGVMIATIPLMHVDASKISGGGKNNFTYETSVGGCVEAGYEIFFSNLISLDLGLRYRYNSFTLKSVTSNGQNIPLDQLPSGFDYIRTIDGSGIDIMGALRFNF